MRTIIGLAVATALALTAPAKGESSASVPMSVTVTRGDGSTVFTVEQEQPRPAIGATPTVQYQAEPGFRILQKSGAVWLWDGGLPPTLTILPGNYPPGRIVLQASAEDGVRLIFGTTDLTGSAVALPVITGQVVTLSHQDFDLDAPFGVTRDIILTASYVLGGP